MKRHTNGIKGDMANWYILIVLVRDRIKNPGGETACPVPDPDGIVETSFSEPFRFLSILPFVHISLSAQQFLEKICS